MTNINLSVVIPAYNEERNLGGNNLNQVFDYLVKQNYTFEMILVNDGSIDGTLVKLNEFAQHKKQVRVIDNPHQGKAMTVTTGMLAAQGRIRLFTDLDQSTPIREIERLFPFIEAGDEVVIGSREVMGSKREQEPIHRHLMGKVFNLVVKMLAIRGIMDTQCGFKLFSQAAAVDLFNRLVVTTKPKKDAFTGAFDVELLFLAQKYGYKIAEVPVIWHHVKSDRINPVKDSARMFFEVLRIRFADITGAYDEKS